MKKEALKALADKWPSAYVARDRVGDFTGGIVSSRYMANLDAAGRGIPDRIRCGRKIIYPVAAIISWLSARVQPVNDRSH